jgi:hypothetical protein
MVSKPGHVLPQTLGGQPLEIDTERWVAFAQVRQISPYLGQCRNPVTKIVPPRSGGASRAREN